MDPPTYEIESQFPSSNELVQLLTDKINEASLASGIVETVRNPFGFVIRDESSNKIIAGCNGCLIYGTMYVDQLWVDGEHRQKGLGRKLLDKAEELARKENIRMICLGTMSFQAEGFYRKQGYIVDFRRKGYAQDSELIFLHKILT